MPTHARKTQVDPLIGMRLELYRRRKALTQKELGQLVGLTGANISHYEKGRSEPPMSKVMELAKHLGVPPEAITGEAWGQFDEAFIKVGLMAVREGGPPLLSLLERLTPFLIAAEKKGMLGDVAKRIFEVLTQP